jgi:uncharacterized membrane protein
MLHSLSAHREPRHAAGTCSEQDAGAPGPTRHWHLRAHRSSAPGQAGLWAAVALSALVGLVSWEVGYPPIAVYAALQMAGLTAALIYHRRHSGDGEQVTLRGADLLIERWRGRQTDRFRFPAAWVNVKLASGTQGPLVLSYCGKHLSIGGRVAIGVRRTVAAELRAALCERPWTGQDPHEPARAKVSAVDA